MIEQTEGQQKDWFLELVVSTSDKWGGYWAPLAVIGIAWAVFMGIMIGLVNFMAWQADYSALLSNIGILLTALIFVPIFLLKTYKAAKEYEEEADGTVSSDYFDIEI